MGVPPPIAAFAWLFGPMPVRSSDRFKSAKDATFARRMNVWNVGSFSTALAIQLRLCATAEGVPTTMIHLLVCALTGAVAAPALQRALSFEWK